MESKSLDDGRRLTWTLTMWVEDPVQYPQTWTGSLKTGAGQRWSFRSLAELEHLLYELGGWIDPSDRGTGDRADTESLSGSDGSPADG